VLKQHPKDPLKLILTRNRSQVGWNAFDELCSNGCEPTLLSWAFLWLYREPAVKAAPKANESRFEWRPAPLDSSKARGEFTLAELDQIASLAKELQQKLPRIRQIPFVRELLATRMLPRNDLLQGESLFLSTDCDSRLNGLVNLGRFGRLVGAQKRPRYAARLKEIYAHIHERTRQWHDRLVAHILNDLDPDKPQTENGLKEWRRRNDCV